MNTSTKKGKGLGEYMPLAFAAGIGSMLGSGIIVGSVGNHCGLAGRPWTRYHAGRPAFRYSDLRHRLRLAVRRRLADKIGRVLFFNWINLFYAIGAAICVFAPNFTVLLIG